MEPPLAEAVEDDTVMIAEFSFGALRGRASLSQDSCRCVCVCICICANSHGDKASIISKAKSLTFLVNVAFLSLFILQFHKKNC